MMRVAVMQHFVAFAAVAVAAVFGDAKTIVSACLGACVYIVPTMCWVATIYVVRHLTSNLGINAAVVLFGEFFKVLLVIVLMLLSGRLFQGLNWLVFLSVLAVVMNSQFLLIFKK